MPTLLSIDDSVESYLRSLPAVIEMQRDTYLMLTRDATVLNFAQWSLS
jgi:hypothetical protein